MSLLADDAELALIRTLAGWPRLVEAAAQAREPHRIAYYLNDVAAGFHGLWNKGNEDVGLRFIIADDAALTKSRLALVRSVAVVIASGLAVMGVKPVEEMR
jgi:arginyl-tRNA synthetase